MSASPIADTRSEQWDSYSPPADWFDRWWEPEGLLREVGTHNEQVPEDAFFNVPELKALQEAYAAAFFAMIRAQSKPCQVRLESDNFPDFELRFDEEDRLFELVEADRPGRRRGLEYRESAERQAAGLEPMSELFDPDEEERAAILAIEMAISRKAKKHYRPKPDLLVYVNFSLFREVPLTGLQAQQLAEPCHDQFASIWLLWGANAIRCWPNPAKIVAREVPTEFL